MGVPGGGGAAVLDLTAGGERLLGYVRVGREAGLVACGGGRLYIASHDNGNVFIYDIGEAMAVAPTDGPPANANGVGLKGVAVLDADVTGLALDGEGRRLWVASHSVKPDDTFDLLTLVEGVSKRQSVPAATDLSDASLPPQLEGGTLYVAAARAGRLLTLDTASYVLSSQPLVTATLPLTISQHLTSTAGSPAYSYQLNSRLILPRYVAQAADGRLLIALDDAVAVVEAGSGRWLRTIAVPGVRAGAAVMVGSE